jgi:hypothetical protein
MWIERAVSQCGDISFHYLGNNLSEIDVHHVNSLIGNLPDVHRGIIHPLHFY